MPIFQQSVLKKYINDLDKENLSATWKAFQSHFHNAAKSKMLCLAFILSANSWAQPGAANLQDFIRSHGNDSIDIFYNQSYIMTGDSCADIIRAGRCDLQQRKFKGVFRDASKANPEQVIATGAYDEAGTKNGEFISYYLNGAQQASGRFQKNLFDGRWEFFYPDGRPQLVFEATGAKVKIISAWNDEGKQTVTKGYGDYKTIGAVTWEGKLVGGTPDGKWIAHTAFSSAALITEQFKLGNFEKGRNQVETYTDSSRIVLVTTALLPFVKAENFWSTREPCNAAGNVYLIPARYPKGAQSFIDEIKERLAPALGNLNPGPFNEPIELQGTIAANGSLTFDGVKGDPKVGAALLSALHAIPSFEPASLNGKRVPQGIVIIINVNSSVYRFSYRLQPLKAN